MRFFTLLFTTISAALCLLHFAGLDPRNMLLFAFSIPMWFVPLFVDIKTVNLFVAYALTIASWALLGYIVDRLVQRNRQRRGSTRT